MAQLNRGPASAGVPRDDDDPYAATPVAAPHRADAPIQSIQPDRLGAVIGSVLGLMLRGRAPPAGRTANGAGEIPAAPLAQAVAGHGLDGDRHADPLSPRQVLLAGAPAYRRHGLAAHTLRENVLLDVDTATLPSGTLLRLGDEVIVALTFHCEACGYLDARHPGIARVIGQDRGVLARVLHGGTLRPGDPVVRLPETLPRGPTTGARAWRISWPRCRKGWWWNTGSWPGWLACRWSIAGRFRRWRASWGWRSGLCRNTCARSCRGGWESRSLAPARRHPRRTAWPACRPSTSATGA
ncbi:MOSC domain-containing protein [Pseudoduganella chitinolytica]|uniref:MOSC domain-containing protein n=1 Tax=Pseudoduganella chitinolytica TaxID=34070 RepID=A0ABY8BE86_9BURK|nr:MOSC domain-containing protein [Pseudoduganella chitinolytica]WEF34016.1 hypothetical protein PX653_04370 [Pseudoduganella chitinolytica]